MVRILKYFWFVAVMKLTGLLPDVRPVMRLRGTLLRPAFKRCGRNFQVCSHAMVIGSAHVEVGDDVYLAYGCWVNGTGGIVLEDEVMLGPYTILATTNHTSKDGSYRFGPHVFRPIRICRGAWTGAHAVVTAGTTVGAGAACAAGAVVTRDVAAGIVVGGAPARPLGRSEGLVREATIDAPGVTVPS